MGTSKFMILVPLFDLKSLGSFCRLQRRDFKSAALVPSTLIAPGGDDGGGLAPLLQVPRAQIVRAEVGQLAFQAFDVEP